MDSVSLSVALISALHGPGLGPLAAGRPGPWAGPGLDDIFAGWAWCRPESCRPGPGPGQSITFMRAAGRAWA